MFNRTENQRTAPASKADSVLLLLLAYGGIFECGRHKG